jgi:poly(3-hydroxybutyrate) depolymerase
MLYHLYESNHLIAKPWRAMAKVFAGIHNHRFNPLKNSLPVRYMSSQCDLYLALTARYAKPEWNISDTVINGARVAIEIETVWQDSFCNLRHFKRDEAAKKHALGKTRNDPRILLIAPLSGHYATLLRGTVEALIPDHEVYITDWVDARTVPVTAGKWDLNDYIDDLMNCLHAIGPKAHIIAICQPGPAALAAVAYMSEHNSPDLPASLTIMGSPIDTRKSPTVPNLLAEKKSYSWFKRNVIHRVPAPNRGAFRKVYPGFLQLGGFITMNKSQHMQAYRGYFNNLVAGDNDNVLKHREFYDEYLAVLDLTAEFYLQTIKDIFQQHKIPKGEFMHHGELIKPECITDVALMTIEGENDDISGIGQTQAAHDLCSNIPAAMKVDYIQPGVGHYGIFNGSRFRKEVRPRINDFIRSHYNAKKELDYRNTYG